MKREEEVTTTCEQCGASVYPEHLTSGIARYEGGKMLCAHCLAEYERGQEAGGGADLEPIALEGFDDSSDKVSSVPSSQIHGASASTLGHAGAWDESRFHRVLNPDVAGATRCRIFHCKLSEGAVEFMNAQINEWLENQADVTVKFVNSTIGMFEGKHTEPNLIMSLFY